MFNKVYFYYSKNWRHSISNFITPLWFFKLRITWKYYCYFMVMKTEIREIK